MTEYSLNIAHLKSHWARVQFGSNELEARQKAAVIAAALCKRTSEHANHHGFTFDFESSTTSGTTQPL